MNAQLRLQDDGNLVVYNGASQPLWGTSTQRINVGAPVCGNLTCDGSESCSTCEVGRRGRQSNDLPRRWRSNPHRSHQCDHCTRHHALVRRRAVRAYRRGSRKRSSPNRCDDHGSGRAESETGFGPFFL